jgi:hypothetical protein
MDLRNTRYQADATPYLGRTSTGWIAPACLAHSLDHLVGKRKKHGRDFDPKLACGLKIKNEAEFCRTLYRHVGRVFASQYACGIGSEFMKLFANKRSVIH